MSSSTLKKLIEDGLQFHQLQGALRQYHWKIKVGCKGFNFKHPLDLDVLLLDVELSTLMASIESGGHDARLEQEGEGMTLRGRQLSSPPPPKRTKRNPYAVHPPSPPPDPRMEPTPYSNKQVCPWRL